jgi:nucleoid-associated protein YgaU
MRRPHLVLVVALSCAGCSASNAVHPPAPEIARAALRPAHLPPAQNAGRVYTEPAPELPPDAPTVPALPGINESDARTRVARAAALVEQTRQLRPGWAQADPAIGRAHEALHRADWGAAAAYAGDAAARAEATLSDHYTRLAQQESSRAQRYTGLDDTQPAQLRAAEETLAAGNGRLAYGRLRSLNQQIEGRIKTYTVQAGDNLWIIAGRPEAYANPQLWPLVWQANLGVLPDPDRLVEGQVLKLRAHPTTDQVAAAIRESERQASLGRGPGSAAHNRR